MSSAAASASTIATLMVPRRSAMLGSACADCPMQQQLDAILLFARSSWPERHSYYF
jgi:hypothetical protein